jgi:cytosine/adenosine deaminase-related metal-dependent hydrolase
MDPDGILAVGQRKDILHRFPDVPVNTRHGVFMPPLVNGHIHLELSHLVPIVPSSSTDTMVSWIEALLLLREQGGFSRQQIVDGIHSAIAEQLACGVVLMADIGNTPEACFSGSAQLPEVYRIHEMVAPTIERSAECMHELNTMPENHAVSPHAPYSTASNLIRALKKRSKKHNHIFSIHLAESPEELEFIHTNGGAFREFLEQRNSWDTHITEGKTFYGAVHYLRHLDVLDEWTLCVHCVHIDDAEIEILAQVNAKVCICAASNDFLGNGSAPLAAMLKKGLLPAIGTDSRASNNSLDTWKEMRRIQDDNPAVSSLTILQMATLGGARALHRENDLGSLAQGKKPAFLEVQIENSDSLSDAALADALIARGGPDTVTWVLPKNEHEC